MLRPLNPTTCHCPFSQSHWFISMSWSQWQCSPPGKSCSRPPFSALFCRPCQPQTVGPMSSFCSQYHSAHGFRIKVVLVEDWQRHSWICTVEYYLIFLYSYPLLAQEIISANLESPREQHIGKLNPLPGVLMVPCVLILTSQYFRAYSRKRCVIVEILWTAIFGAHL